MRNVPSIGTGRLRDSARQTQQLAQVKPRMNTYLIVIGKTATGYSAHAPDVLGCAAVGKTVDEVRTNMKKALALHFEGLAEDGDPIPRPGGIASYRQVMKDLDVDHYFLGHVQIETRRFAQAARSLLQSGDVQSAMPKRQIRKGALVRFRLGTRFVQGEVKEDCGPIGVKGRHLYLIEFHSEHEPLSPSQIELPAVDVEVLPDPLPTSRALPK